MKKLNLILVSMLAFCLVMSSCKKEDDTLKGENIVVKKPTTPEDHKKNLEQTGISMAKEFSGFTNEPAMDVMNRFSSIMESLPLLESDDDSDLGDIFRKMSDVSNNKNLKSISNLLKDGDKIIKMQDEWDAIAGTWDYNSSKDEFEESNANSKDLIINFPSDDKRLNNNAKIIFYEPEWYTGKYFFADSIAGKPDKLPVGLKMELLVDGTAGALLTYDVKISFDDQGNPSLLLTNLTIGGYLFSYQIKNDQGKNVGTTLTFKHNKAIICEVAGKIAGNWTEKNINDNINEEVRIHNQGEGYYEYEYDNEWMVVDSFWRSYEWEESVSEVKMENIVHNVEVSVQLLNVKMVGSINTKGLIPEIEKAQKDNEEAMQKFYDGQTYDNDVEYGIDSAYVIAQEKIWNKYLLAKLVYVSNGQLLAKIEPHPNVEVEEQGQNEYKYISLEPYFVFNDNTRVDPETYFSEGWNDLIDEMNKIISDLNKDFELGIEPIPIQDSPKK